VDGMHIGRITPTFDIKNISRKKPNKASCKIESQAEQERNKKKRLRKMERKQS